MHILKPNTMNPDYTPLYIATTFAYGASRKYKQVSNAKVRMYYTSKKDSSTTYTTIPMLTSTKIMTSVIGGCVGIFAWPLYLYKDVSEVEMAYKYPLTNTQICTEQPYTVIDYILS